MKFISLVLLFACFSSFAQDEWAPIPEEDQKYLAMDAYALEYWEPHFSYGCFDFDVVSEGKSFQNFDGSWTDHPPVKACRKYCRPRRDNETTREDVAITCNINVFFSTDKSLTHACTGGGRTLKEAKEDAKSTCNYIVRQRYHNDESVSIGKPTCTELKICFDVKHENDQAFQRLNDN